LRQAVGAVWIVRAVPVLAEIDPPEPSVWPKLSVIIPACNEAETIEAAAETVLRQDYPNLEIILVDDRCDDGTGRIIERIAAGDDRVRALHVTELPDGWLGKVHALKYGLERAAGGWVLFSDADVHLSGDVLRRVVAYCEGRRMDHLAAAPDIWPTTFLTDVAVAMFLRSFCVLMRCWAVEDPRSKAFVGVGAFNLVRRSALEQTPGLEWLKLEVADDVGLGMMLKRCGARCGMVNARGLVGLHWYPTLGHMARGMEKAFASAAHCRVARLLVICALTAGLELAPLAAFLPLGHRGLWPAGAAMIASAVLSVVVLARWTRGRVLPGLLFPLGAVLNTALLLRSGWLGVRRGGIVWRGMFYPSRVLRKGIRVRFP